MLFLTLESLLHSFNWEQPLTNPIGVLPIINHFRLCDVSSIIEHITKNIVPVMLLCNIRNLKLRVDRFKEKENKFIVFAFIVLVIQLCYCDTSMIKNIKILSGCQLYGFGDNRYGQLGNNLTATGINPTPILVSGFNNSLPIKYQVSNMRAVHVLTENGRVSI